MCQLGQGLQRRPGAGFYGGQGNTQLLGGFDLSAAAEIK